MEARSPDMEASPLSAGALAGDKVRTVCRGGGGKQLAAPRATRFLLAAKPVFSYPKPNPLLRARR